MAHQVVRSAEHHPIGSALTWLVRHTVHRFSINMFQFGLTYIASDLFNMVRFGHCFSGQQNIRHHGYILGGGSKTQKLN